MFFTEPTARAALRPSSARERRIALGLALSVSAVFIIWPVAGIAPMPYSPQFFAAYATAQSLCMLFAAVLLVFRARLVGDDASAIIAAAFVYSVPLLVAYGVTFPGLGPAWLWRPDASPWLIWAWRAGWPAVIAYEAIRHRTGAGHLVRYVAAGAVASTTVIAVILSGALPQLRPENGAPTSLALAANATALLVNVIALVALLRRRRITTLDTWLAAALVVQVTTIFLLCFPGARYSSLATAIRLASLSLCIMIAASLVYEFQRLLARSTSLERFMTMAQYASTIVYLLDANGSCVYVNRRWVEVTGQAAEAALGAGWAEVVHPDDLTRQRPIYQQSLEDRQPHELELRYRCADGNYRWFLASATPTFDTNGAIDGWYGTATDVDRQHLALEEAQRLEREAAERESDIRRIAETIPLIAWTARPDGAIDWCNQRWIEYTGQSFAEAMDWGWRTAPHPDDLPIVVERWLHSVRTATPFEIEYRLRGRDGAYRWFLTRATPIVDDAGNVIKWYGTNTDTNDQRQQSDQLALLYAREHELAETLQTAFIPPFLPQVDGLDFQAVYRPALGELELGGDWYDAFVLRDGRIAISIGDIAGHGIDAAIAMVRLREMLRAVTGFMHADPGAILEIVDRSFAATHPSGIATAAFALYDPVTRSLACARAGHPAPVLVRGGTATLLPGDTGAPLGVDVDSRYVASSAVLEPGDTIVFYTDGLLEMDRDVIAGERHFMAVIERNGADVEAIVDETLDGRQRDDVALLRLTVLEHDIASWHFKSDDAASADDARYAFAAHLRRRVADDAVVAAAELVFGELIGNVVRHAPGPIEIDLAWRSGTPLLIVRDRGPQFSFTEGTLPDDPLAEGGRGLFLVQRYASPPVVVPRFGGGNEVVVALAAPDTREPVASGGSPSLPHRESPSADDFQRTRLLL